MAVQIDTGKALSTLSLTPLIDIVFLLLIFFLVATRFAEEERELDVLLPDASEAQPLTSKPGELFINIDQQGRYYVTGKILTLEELDRALRTASVNNPGRVSVIIRADKRVVWNYVVAAMNACNKAKIRDYRVTTLQGRGTP
jgi:biopolymer transport protein ExbD